MFLVLCGEPPFWDWDGDDEAVYAKIIKCDFSFSSPHWGPVSAEAKDMVLRLLVLNPKERLSADQALRHPFVLGTSLEGVGAGGGGVERAAAEHREGGTGGGAQRAAADSVVLPPEHREMCRLSDHGCCQVW